MKVLIKIDRLISFCNPYECCPWDCKQITKRHIKRALEKNLFSEICFDTVEWNEGTGSDWTHIDHAKRIAYFVKNKWKEPIEIDVGVPSMQYSNDWLITDGNHRLAAAIYRGDKYIKADVFGEIGYANEIFGTRLKTK